MFVLCVFVPRGRTRSGRIPPGEFARRCWKDGDAKRVKRPSFRRTETDVGGRGVSCSRGMGTTGEWGRVESRHQGKGKIQLGGDAA